ncbi:MAG: segregation and condensation protein A [Muricoprocola sp.]
MGISIKLQKFEGPLDLLLHLIDKNKVDIFDIPIVEITDQYMEYLQEMDADMGTMSEFLVMAATLLDIKARMLLPKEVNEEGEEEDPRQELVERLLEYKMYKYMSYELRDRQEDAEKVLYREQSLPKEVLEYKQPVDLDELLAGVTIEKLNQMFKDIIRRQEARTDPIRSKFGQVEKEEVNLEETIAYVEDYISKHKKCSFRNLLNHQKSKMKIIITFLTILEMMKTGKIEVEQDEIFAEIMITAK